MKLSLRTICLFLLVLLGAATASADGLTLTLDNPPGSYSLGGVYVGPYNFTETINGQSQSLQLICDIFTQEVYVGESWTAVTSTFPSLSNVEQPSLGTAAQYQEIGWLVEQMNTIIQSHTATNQSVGDLQWAIWAVFDPAILKPGWKDPYGTISQGDWTAIQSDYNAAVAACGNGNCTFSNLTIYTPVSGSQPNGDGLPQEYFGVPEPGTLLLMVTGLLGLLVFWRRFLN
jgi:hypothetical protein